MKRFNVAVSFLALVVALAAGAACNFNWNQNAPSPIPSASPSPSPSASPTSGPQTSDVASMAIFAYGFRCAPGTPEPSHFEAIIPPACTEVALTATPKQTDGKTDAKQHGQNLSWDFDVSPLNAATVVAGPENLVFNRTVKVATPRVPGSVVFTAKLVAPDGNVHVATKTVTIQ